MTRDFERQYRSVKQKHPGMLVLFRRGDDYLAIDDDADMIAKTLGLVLTTRPDLKVAGFPRENLEPNLRELLRGGHRVAICETGHPTTASSADLAPAGPTAQDRQQRPPATLW